MTADSDADLWQKMAGTVVRKSSSRAHPLGDNGAAPATKTPAKKRKAPLARDVQPSPKLKKPIVPADLRLGQRAGIDRSSTKRLTQGRYEIDDKLDLHGMTQAAAHTKLRHFILSASAKGFRTVLVITGKGAAGRGVLRTQVPIWLKEAPLGPVVMAISEASGKDGGGGALYVRLRRDRKKTS